MMTLVKETQIIIIIIKLIRNRQGKVQTNCSGPMLGNTRSRVWDPDQKIFDNFPPNVLNC